MHRFEKLATRQALRRALAAALVTACGSSAPAEKHPDDAGRADVGTLVLTPHDAAVHEEAGNDALPIADAKDAAQVKPTISFVDLATGSPEPRILLGDQVDIVLSGMPPSTEVTLDACLNGYGTWTSRATFRSDAHGNVDVAGAAPLSGSYDGADSDGPFWSMTPDRSACDPAVPVNSVGVTATVSGKTVATATLAWLLPGSGVTCQNVTDHGFVGYFCAPVTGSPKRGGIVAFGGSEGGLGSGQELAEYYASLGYPTLGLAYFGATGLPSTLANIPLEYFEPAFAWLDARPEVTPGKLLVNGISRGGELALLLGATFHNVTAVVAELPSGVRWPSLDGTEPGWTYKGKPLPYISAAFTVAPEAVTEPGGAVAYAYVAAFTAALAASTAKEIEEATTAVEETRGPILMIGGFDDQLWGACNLAGYSVARLTASGHADRYADSLLCYPGAGHDVIAFDLDLPTTRAMYFEEMGGNEALGGTPQGIAHASRDADDKKRTFFAANL